MFPIDNEVYWKMHFNKYVTLRLYLPELLYSLDAVIYLDSDTLLLDDIAQLWGKFAEFNTKQMIGVVSNIGWYSYGTATEYPFYGEYGINAGVMLMNLTRLRAFELRKHFIPIYSNYSKKIKLADQCLLNIFFFYNPGNSPEGYCFSLIISFLQLSGSFFCFKKWFLS